MEVIAKDSISGEDLSEDLTGNYQALLFKSIIIFRFITYHETVCGSRNWSRKDNSSLTSAI